jgi:hypothetical protein
MHRASVEMTAMERLPADAKRLMLAITGRLKKPRVVPGGPDNERWARAWARRWWVVAAANADQARAAIARYEEKLAKTPLAEPLDASAFGVLAAGRNAGGSPDVPPWKQKTGRALRGRPSPNAAMPRRDRARGHAAQGAVNH